MFALIPMPTPTLTWALAIAGIATARPATINILLIIFFMIDVYFNNMNIITNKRFKKLINPQTKCFIINAFYKMKSGLFSKWGVFFGVICFYKIGIAFFNI